MSRFIVYVTFAGERAYVVEADDPDEAYQKYKEGEVIHDKEDFEHVDLIEPDEFTDYSPDEVTQ